MDFIARCEAGSNLRVRRRTGVGDVKTTGRSDSEVLDAVRKAKALPNGWYEAEIAEAVDTMSKRNREMIALTGKVVEPDGNTRIIKDYITDAALVAAKFRHLCEACGVLDKYEAGEVSASDLAGNTVRAKISTENKKPFPP